ncbi:helix-turn-helix domain-containing protein [bacterium]|nr:MAG: helix-turn-helix domain-containing protein [bacterium]
MASESLSTRIAEELKSKRKSLNLTQREVAEYAGCHWTLVLDVEAGRSTVRLDKLLAILHVVGLDLDLKVTHGS